MTWLMDKILRRHRRPSLSPPPARPDGTRAAREEIRRAEDTLTNLERQEAVVDDLHQRADGLLRRNHLGPAFMKALGERRA